MSSWSGGAKRPLVVVDEKGLGGRRGRWDDLGERREDGRRDGTKGLAVCDVGRRGRKEWFWPWREG